MGTETEMEMKMEMQMETEKLNPSTLLLQLRV